MAQTRFDHCTALLANDLVAAINATTDAGAEKQSIDVQHINQGALYLYAKGAVSGCTGNLTFYFQVSPDGSNWFDLPGVVVPMNGTSQVTDKAAVVPLDLSGVEYLRLDRVANAETVAGRTATVNASLYRKGF